MIYTDLAMTYYGIDEIEFALEYLSKSIQSLERDQTENMHTKLELAEQYITLADMLRKQGSHSDAI